MSYKRTVWVNDSLPAINAKNLNNIENGIEANDTAIGNLSSLNTTNKSNLVSAINEIVEGGSNDNGRWIKYSDGTMIQYGSIKKNVSITTLSNTGKYYYQDDINIILPINFIDSNYYSNVIAVNNQNGSQNVYSVRNKTQSKFDFCLSSLISYSSNDNTFWWFAIGRWK